MIRYSFLLIMLFATRAYAGEQIQFLKADGEEVSIPIQAVADQCENAVSKSHEFNLEFKNDDGSVSFHNPRFYFNGQHLRITTDYSSIDGFCKRKGFKDSVPNSTTFEPALESTEVIDLSYDGTFNYKTTIAPRTPMLRSITCRKKL